MGSRAGSALVANMVVLALAAAMALSLARPAAAYAVLAHEANIDALWDNTISKMLLARFPGATPEELLDARAYAYGAGGVHDLGQCPLGCPLLRHPSHHARS